jgi:hypothetical protein
LNMVILFSRDSCDFLFISQYIFRLWALIVFF